MEETNAAEGRPIEETLVKVARDSADAFEALQESVRALVREHPAACLVGSALLGFAAARLLRREGEE